MSPTHRPRFTAAARLLASIGLGFAAGCRTPDRAPPPPPPQVAILVRDAETKAPVPGAVVSLTALPAPHAPAAEPATGTAGADGIARVADRPHGGTDVVLEASAAGYVTAKTDVSARPLAAVDPIGPAPATVVELFAGPRPGVELQLPAGYRGPVKAGVRARDDAPGGQRSFRYVVPPSGVVEMAGPAVLRELTPADVRAVYPDGTAINSEAADAEVGFRRVKTVGDTFHFFVGTKAQADEFRKTLDLPEPGAGGRTAGEKNDDKGGRRGGRGKGQRMTTGLNDK